MVLFDAYPHLMGGAQRTLLSVAAELGARGRPPTLLAPGEGPLTAEARRLSIPVVVVPLPEPLGRFGRSTSGRHRLTALASLPTAWSRLGRAIAGARAEVVHVDDHRGALLAGPAARRRRVPFVWHAHSVDVDGAWIERSVGRSAAAVVAPSDAALRELPHLGRGAAAAVVRPPIDDRVRALGPVGPSTGARIVTAARLHPAKGLETALRAVAVLLGEGRPVHLDVYGGPQPGAEDHALHLRSLVRSLDLTGRVELHGHVEDPQARWAGAAVYLQPSNAETFGMAAAEAMAMGLPVVASAVGGLAELIDDGRTGRLVPPGDPAAMAAALADLLDDPPRAHEMGLAGREAVGALTPQATVDALDAVWARAAGR